MRAIPGVFDRTREAAWSQQKELATIEDGLELLYRLKYSEEPLEFEQDVLEAFSRGSLSIVALPREGSAFGLDIYLESPEDPEPLITPIQFFDESHETFFVLLKQ